MANGAGKPARSLVNAVLCWSSCGATRLRLIGAYTIEYLLIAAATAVFGVLSGTAASWLIVTELMRLPFSWQPGAALAATLAAVLVTVVLGLAGTFSALGQKPAPVLRNL